MSILLELHHHCHKKLDLLLHHCLQHFRFHHRFQRFHHLFF
jgi:hypothetical protein